MQYDGDMAHYDPPPGSFEGRFSDGKTARSRDALVSFTSRGLAIRVDGSSQDLVWPYGALATSEPLGSHAVDALLSYTYQPGASLFVPSGAFARRLVREAPHLTTGAARRRAAVPWLWAAAGIVAVIASVSMLQLSPARFIASLLPEKVRSSLGEQTVRAMVRDKGFCERAEGKAALDKLATRLTKAGSRDKPFDIVVADWGLVNAFATPGDKIVLTRGLIEKAGDADEVAGVLAHEMGHAIALHPETSVVRGLGLTAAMELLLGGGGGTMGNIGVLLAQLSYTRQAEAEADETALSLLKNAGISAAGFGRFFRRMGKDDEGDEPATDNRNVMKKPSSGGVLDMLRTHPPTADRIRRVDSADKYPATPALAPHEWNALKSICAANPG